MKLVGFGLGMILVGVGIGVLLMAGNALAIGDGLTIIKKGPTPVCGTFPGPTPIVASVGYVYNKLKAGGVCDQNSSSGGFYTFSNPKGWKFKFPINGELSTSEISAIGAMCFVSTDSKGRCLSPSVSNH